MKRIALALILLSSCSTHKAHLNQKADMLVVPVIQASKTVELGTINQSTLRNGLRVISIPRQVGSVEIVLAIQAGHDNDPITMSGLSDFTVSMLRKGTKKRSAAEIAQSIDFVGGSISTISSNDAVFLTCQARSKDLAVCLNLIADLVQNPTFPTDEIDGLKQQFAGSIQSARDSARALASEHAANLFWSDDSVRGRPISMQSIANVNRKAIKDFFETWFAPNNSILSIAGDFDQALVEKTFSTWTKKNVPSRKDSHFPTKGELKVRLVDKPDATQSTIVIRGPGISHGNKDFYAVELMNYAFGGGGFSSRLMKVIRSEGGKTYGASSSFEAGRDAGPFTVSTFTRTSETGATLKLLFNQIEKMRADGPTTDELEAAKANIVGGFGLRIETGGDLANLVLGGKMDGLSDDYLVTYPQRMSEVTIAQARDVAARYLFPTTLVIVGNAKEVIPQLKQMGMTIGETILFTEPVSASERNKV